MTGEFLWDDNALILNNSPVQAANGLRQIWFSTVPYDYFPLTNSSFWLEWRLWGADPLGYRLTNLALHLAAVAFLWRLLTVLRVPGAWFGALLFAVHPVNVASVAWISERKNALSMVFFLATLIVWLRAEDAFPHPRLAFRWRGVALVCFGLAVLSKSSVVMLPCVLLLLAWWRRGRVTVQDLLHTLPFFLVSLLGGLATMWFQYHQAMPLRGSAAVDPFAVRLLVVPRVILFYLGKTFAPVNLLMIYPRWTVQLSSPAACLPWLALALVAWVLWRVRHRLNRGVYVALGYFLLTLLPVSGLMPMSFFTFSYVSDHLVHLSMLGLLAAVAAGLTILRARPGWSPALTAAMFLLTVGLAFGAHRRAAEFGSSALLWEHTLAQNPDSSAAHNNLGWALEQKGELPAAESHYRAALRLEPDTLSASINLAALLQREQRWQESAAAYQSILANQPDAESFNNYGVVCLHLDDPVRAKAQFYSAVRLEHRLLGPHFNLYKVALAGGDPRGAARELVECVRYNPDDVPSLLALAELSLRAAPPGTVPPAAVTLARRVCRLSGDLHPLACQIVAHANQYAPCGHMPARMPEIAAQIERCVRDLPGAGQPGLTG